MVCHSPSRVRSAAWRRAALNLAKACSIGVRTAGRQIDELCALRGDRFGNAGGLVAAQIVEQDDIVRSQGRRQHLFDIGAKAFAIDGAVKDARCRDPMTTQTGHQGGHLPMPMRHWRQ